jgi:ABC-2 type transport system ATP-binding protein
VSGPLAIRTQDLGKRYGTSWALHDCTLEIPTGSVTALVGPNGAGKTTLLHLVIGLSEPTEGAVEVLGLSPQHDAAALLPRLGFVAQDHPLYRGLTIAETFKLARKLNTSWDDRVAEERVERLGLRLGHKVGTLSGGQQAQVALTLALAKRPELLILDEPVASLDPLARREFLTAVMEAVAETGVTVVLSSHIVSELERVCDYLITLSSSRTQLAGPISEILASHRLLTGPRSDGASVARVHDVIRESHTARQTTLLVRANGHVYDSCWEQEEIVLASATSRANEPSLPRRWRRSGRDLGRLTAAAHRDADRARHPCAARGAARPDGDHHGRRLSPRRDRLLHPLRQRLAL